MLKQVSIPYGKFELSFQVDENRLSDILTPVKQKCIPDPEQECMRALEEPIGSKGLSELVNADMKIVIICDDNTRLTPTHIIVPLLIKEMEKGGAQINNIKIVIACGTHRPMTDEEMIEKLGSALFYKVRVLNHDCMDNKNLVDLGSTEGGTPIVLNKHVFDADFVIGVGCIVPHLVPGFSGGAKIVQPGVCGVETTAATHLASLRWGERTFLGVVENPIRKELEDVAALAGVHHIFNVVLDHCGRMVKAFFGDMGQAYREGVKTCQSVYGVPVKSQTPIVIASSSPCDIDFWQAHKALYSSEMVVKKGGVIILAAPCPEGISPTHPELTEFVHLKPEEIDRKIAKGEIKDQVAGAAGLQWSKVRQQADVCLVSSGITAEDASKLGFLYSGSIEEALESASEKYGKDAGINILTHAPDILPLLSDLK